MIRLLVVLATLGAAGCGSRDNRLQELAETVPDFPPPYLECLALEDDSAYFDCVREIGFDCLYTAQVAIEFALNECKDFKEYKRKSEVLNPHQGRLQQARQEVFGVPPNWIPPASPEVDYRLRQLGLEMSTIIRARGDSAALAKNLDRLYAIQDSLPAIGATLEDESFLLGAIAGLKMHLGMDYRQDLERSIRGRRKMGGIVAYCQGLGTLGAYHLGAGHVDSAMAVYDSVLAISSRHRIASQHARILTFMAGIHMRDGNLEVALDLNREAQRVAVRDRAWNMTPRFILGLSRFYLELGEVERAREWYEQYEAYRAGAPPGGVYPLYLLEGANVQALILEAQGLHGQADSVAGAVDDSFRANRPMVYYLEFLLDRADIASGGGRFAEGESLYTLVLDRDPHSTRSVRGHLGRARARFAAKDISGAEADLQGFRREANNQGGLLRFQQEWIDHDLLMLQIARAGVDTSLVYDRARACVRRVQEVLASLTPSGLTYVYLDKLQALREALRDLVPDDNGELGYWLEMAWLELFADPRGRSERLEVLLESLARGDAESRCRAWTNDLNVPLERHDAVHVLLVPRGDSVYRWVVTGRGIRAEGPVARTASCEGALSSVLSSRDEDSVPSLKQLGGALLGGVPEIQEASALLTTVEGFLSLLPLSALDVSGPGPFHPLVENIDTARLLSVNLPPGDQPVKNTSLIVCNPELPSFLRRRYPSLPRLAGSEDEARLAEAALPNPVILRGRDARKEAIKSVWEDAAVVYIASHFIRDPEVALMSFIPVAGSGRELGADSYLGMGDILGGDFRGTDLVVLSGCGSGTPHVSTRAVIPSLGDAFVEAGAAAAVHALWEVEDEPASRLMGPFLEAYRSGASPQHSLAEAKREFFGADPAATLSVWAAYEVSLRGLELEPEGNFQEAAPRTQVSGVQGAN